MTCLMSQSFVLGLEFEFKSVWLHNPGACQRYVGLENAWPPQGGRFRAAFEVRPPELIGCGGAESVRPFMEVLTEQVPVEWEHLCYRVYQWGVRSRQRRYKQKTLAGTSSERTCPGLLRMRTRSPSSWRSRGPVKEIALVPTAQLQEEQTLQWRLEREQKDSRAWGAGDPSAEATGRAKC